MAQFVDLFIDDFERLVSEIRRKSEGRRDRFLDEGNRAIIEAARLSKKLILASSTMKLVREKIDAYSQVLDELRAANPDFSLVTVIEQLMGERGIWIQFSEPFDEVAHRVKVALLFTPAFYMATGKDQQQVVLLGEDRELVELLEGDRPGDRLEYLAVTHTCPTGGCQPSGGRDLLRARISPCEMCSRRLDIWNRVINLSLIVSGQYLAEQLYQEVEVHSVRRIPRQHSRGKDRRKPVKHVFSVIDADRLIIPVVVDADKPESHKRGSWMEDGDFIMEKIRTRPFKRTYRSARYTRMQGQTQEFPDGVERMQPRRPQHLGKHITHVRASKHEGGEKNW